MNSQVLAFIGQGFLFLLQLGVAAGAILYDARIAALGPIISAAQAKLPDPFPSNPKIELPK